MAEIQMTPNWPSRPAEAAGTAPPAEASSGFALPPLSYLQPPIIQAAAMAGDLADVPAGGGMGDDPLTRWLEAMSGMSTRIGGTTDPEIAAMDAGLPPAGEPLSPEDGTAAADDLPGQTLGVTLAEGQTGLPGPMAAPAPAASQTFVEAGGGTVTSGTQPGATASSPPPAGAALPPQAGTVPVDPPEPGPTPPADGRFPALGQASGTGPNRPQVTVPPSPSPVATDGAMAAAPSDAGAATRSETSREALAPAPRPSGWRAARPAPVGTASALPSPAGGAAQTDTNAATGTAAAAPSAAAGPDHRDSTALPGDRGDGGDRMVSPTLRDAAATPRAGLITGTPEMPLGTELSGPADGPRATSALASGTSVTPQTVDPRQILRQVTEALVTTRADHTEIALSPEELGRIRLVMTGADRSHITLWAERPETLDLVRRNADLLVQHLAEAGVAADSLDFRRDDRAARPEGVPPPPDEDDAPGLPAAQAVRLAPAPLSDRRLDIRI